jgi:hypothetical protein
MVALTRSLSEGAETPHHNAGWIGRRFPIPVGTAGPNGAATGTGPSAKVGPGSVPYAESCLLALMEHLNRQGGSRAVYANLDSPQGRRIQVVRA